MTAKAASGHLTTRAFTLIELLIVIVIIGVLMAVVLTVAGRVTAGGKQRLTESTIQLCDKMYTECVASRGRLSESFVDDAGREFPLVDGRVASGLRTGPINVNGAAEPSLSLFLLIGMKVPEVESIVKSLDPRFVERVPLTGQLGPVQVRDSTGMLTTAQGIVIKDGFGAPIRFVHPAYDGGFGQYLNQAVTPPALANTRDNLAIVRRNGPGATTTSYYSRSYRPWAPAAGGTADGRLGDADEGICPSGGAGYFYSAGMDGDPGTRDDNVYSVRPQFPQLTGSFN